MTTRPVSSVLTRLTIAASAACAVLLITATPVSAQSCATVEVHNVRPQQGFLMVAAYTDADSYNKKPATQMRLAVGDANMTFQLCGLTGDVVALSLFQDLDSDGKMGQNLLGMPIEPWGASGSPGAFGPKWDTTRVPLNGSPIVVKMSL